MRNPTLAADHVRRADARLKALDTLYGAESWADVVRESQETVELALKGLLRAVGIDPPRVHDVADVLDAERSQLPAAMAGEIDRLAAASRGLRRDRELAFLGADDLVPSDFYRKRDATDARADAHYVVDCVRAHVQGACIPPTSPGLSAPAS